MPPQWSSGALLMFLRRLPPEESARLREGLLRHEYSDEDIAGMLARPASAPWVQGQVTQSAPRYGQQLTGLSLGRHRNDDEKAVPFSTEKSNPADNIRVSCGGYRCLGKFMYWHSGHSLPYEGWKFHITALPELARLLLEIVCPVLIQNAHQHKYVRNRKIMRAELVGEQVGKFITIYPRNMAEARRVKARISPLLESLPGWLRTARPAPFDKRLGASGILTTRYGAFKGEEIFGRDRITKVADLRTGYKPDWVEDPWDRMPSGNEDVPWTEKTF